MKTFLFFTALLFGGAAQPMMAQVVWQLGEAILNTGITIRGELCYQPEANALLIRIADKCRVYPADQLHHFELVEKATSVRRFFTVFDVPQPAQQDVAPIIFEEIVPGATVCILQLAGGNARRVGRQYGLPVTRRAEWQTAQPWYIWIEGRFVAPDEFVETEIDKLLPYSPESFQRWANTKPRPDTPQFLARWLALYHYEMDCVRRSLTSR